jgi:hypothetical protein
MRILTVGLRPQDLIFDWDFYPKILLPYMVKKIKDYCLKNNVSGIYTTATLGWGMAGGLAAQELSIPLVFYIPTKNLGGVWCEKDKIKLNSLYEYANIVYQSEFLYSSVVVEKCLEHAIYEVDKVVSFSTYIPGTETKKFQTLIKSAGILEDNLWQHDIDLYLAKNIHKIYTQQRIKEAEKQQRLRLKQIALNKKTDCFFNED